MKEAVQLPLSRKGLQRKRPADARSSSSRIEELRKRAETKLDFAPEDLSKFLIDIIKAKPEEATPDNPRCELAMSKQGPYWRFPSKLAAAEQLARINGYN